ncbi:MAG: hypothetical protein ACOC7N_03965, partial [Chloroflexota bacterium]
MRSVLYGLKSETRQETFVTVLEQGGGGTALRWNGAKAPTTNLCHMEAHVGGGAGAEAASENLGRRWWGWGLLRYARNDTSAR